MSQEAKGISIPRRVYQRNIPLALCAAVIVIVLSHYFAVKNEPTRILNATVTQWTVIITAIAMLYGQVALILSRTRRLILRRGNRKTLYNDAVLIGSFLFVIILGLALPGGETDPTFVLVYSGTIALIEIGIGALRCVYHAWTSFRILSRVSTLEPAVFLVAFFLTALRELTSAVAILPPIGPAASWLMDVPNMAVTRAVVAAAGIGSLVLGMRAVVGREPGLIEVEAV
jgi:hypothetical protein